MGDDSLVLAQRLLRLEARQSIADLVANYCFLLDARRISEVAGLFSENARYATVAPGLDVRGRVSIAAYFADRFQVLGITNHVIHQHTASFLDGRPGRATGTVSSHAEIVAEGKAMLVALRYEDRYVLESGAWCFAERLMTFLYYAPVDSYANALLAANATSSVKMPGR